MATGLGLFSLGATPFGFGTPVVAQAPPTTLPNANRFINFRTKDYERGPDGELRRMPSTRHRVLVILSTTLGSATVLPGLGTKLPERIDQRYPQLAEQAIRLALRPMVAANELKILFVRVVRSPVSGRVDHTVGFVDMTTGNSDTATI
jgi:hypothetical protein